MRRFEAIRPEETDDSRFRLIESDAIMPRRPSTKIRTGTKIEHQDQLPRGAPCRSQARIAAATGANERVRRDLGLTDVRSEEHQRRRCGNDGEGDGGDERAARTAPLWSW